MYLGWRYQFSCLGLKQQKSIFYSFFHERFWWNDEPYLAFARIFSIPFWWRKLPWMQCLLQLHQLAFPLIFTLCNNHFTINIAIQRSGSIPLTNQNMSIKCKRFKASPCHCKKRYQNDKKLEENGLEWVVQRIPIHLACITLWCKKPHTFPVCLSLQQ